MESLSDKCFRSIRPYIGKPIEIMPRMREDNMAPVSVADIVTMRLKYTDGTCWNRFLSCTGDAIAYHPDGSLKIVLDARPLRELAPDSVIVDGALVLPDGIYKALEGREYKLSNLNRGSSFFSLNKERHELNPFMQFLLRDHALSDNLVNSTIYRGGDMVYRVVYGNREKREIVTMRPLGVMMINSVISVLDVINLDEKSCYMALQL